MAEYVDVNGAQIEQGFLEANIAEARSYDWVRTDGMDVTDDHVHCIVCFVAIARQEAYRSESAWLCTYCYSHFVNAKA
jgi:hypothetical protein